MPVTLNPENGEATADPTTGTKAAWQAGAVSVPDWNNETRYAHRAPFNAPPEHFGWWRITIQLYCNEPGWARMCSYTILPGKTMIASLIAVNGTDLILGRLYWYKKVGENARGNIGGNDRNPRRRVKRDLGRPYTLREWQTRWLRSLSVIDTPSDTCYAWLKANEEECAIVMRTAECKWRGDGVDEAHTRKMFLKFPSLQEEEEERREGTVIYGSKAAVRFENIFFSLIHFSDI